jgi:hypothetical protein
MTELFIQYWKILWLLARGGRTESAYIDKCKNRTVVFESRGISKGILENVSDI